MSRSGRYLNFTVSLTPATGSLTAYSEIQGVRVARGAKQLYAFGDARLFPTLVVNTERHRSVTLSGGDVSKMLQLNPETTYTVTAILLDAKNGAGSGAITITLLNAVIEANEANAQANDWGLSTITFNAYSADGTADPLSITEAT